MAFVRRRGCGFVMEREVGFMGIGGWVAWGFFLCFVNSLGMWEMVRGC